MSDDNALTFVLERRHRLFPAVPVVFCGINNYTEAMIRGQDRITGVTEDIDIKGTLALAKALLPGLGRFLVMNDDTPTGIANEEKFECVRSSLDMEGISFETAMRPCRVGNSQRGESLGHPRSRGQSQCHCSGPPSFGTVRY